MKKTLSKGTIVKTLVVTAFVAAFAAGFVFLWTKADGAMPGFSQPDFEFAFRSPEVSNLQEGGDVSIAGVVVGRVATMDAEPDGVLVTVTVDRTYAPLHEGATARVGMKSIVGQNYVDIVDGDGAPLPNNSVLPKSAVKPPVDLDGVLRSLDSKTRKALSGAVRSLGTATEGTSDDLDRFVRGLGDLGREGHTALDAIAAQSEDLTSLVRKATVLLDTLDTGRGQIADVVRDANRLTSATAGQRGALEETVRDMPRLLRSARTGVGKVRELSKPLTPVAADLKRAAPDLNKALLLLPSVSRDLRGLLPALDGVLDGAPATLERIPTLGSDVRTLVPVARATLRDVNPMLAYLAPYGRDVGAMAASFGASMDLVDHNGVRPIRLAPIFDSASFRGVPAEVTLDPTHWTNPYPEPGQAGNPKPFDGDYPRVERSPK